MKNISSRKRSYLFLKYIVEEAGFNPENSEGILELGQSPFNSISRYLCDYNQYLLSKKVTYDKLEEFNLNGACGCLKYSGIYIPKSLYNDMHFLKAPTEKVIYGVRRHGYDYPSIDEFDSIICEGVSSDILELGSYDKDIFIGYCESLDKEEELERIHSFYRNVFEYIDIVTDGEYKMQVDIDSTLRKEFCVIKRKR